MVADVLVVTEGYGMTETSCLISGSQPGDNTSGHVGAPSPSCGKVSYVSFRFNYCLLQ